MAPKTTANKKNGNFGSHNIFVGKIGVALSSQFS
jgi:hypothetical protein